MSEAEDAMDMDTVPADLDTAVSGSADHKAPEDMDVNLAVELSLQTARKQSPDSRGAETPADATVAMPSSSSSSGSISSARNLATSARVSDSPTYSLSILLCALAEDIGEDVLKRMKFICLSNGWIPRARMQKVEDALDLFSKLQEGGWIKPYDLLLLQSLLWFAGARDLFKKVASYAVELMRNPLHLFAPCLTPINGYTHVKFHVRGPGSVHTAEWVSSLRSQVAHLMQVPSSFVLIDGLETGSLWITLAVPTCLCEAFLERMKATPSLLSHWNVVQIVLEKEVVDLEGGPPAVEEMDESTLLDELGRKSQELEALVENNRELLAGVEAAYHHCCSAAQKWILQPDQECQQLLQGLQELQTSMPGQTETALHSMVQQLVEANRLLSQPVSLRELLPGSDAEKFNTKAEQQIQALKDEILKLRLKIVKMRSAKRLRATKPGRPLRRRHSFNVVSSAVAMKNTRRGPIHSVSMSFMSFSMCHIFENSNQQWFDRSVEMTESDFDAEDSGAVGLPQPSEPQFTLGFRDLLMLTPLKKDPIQRMLKGVCLIFADENSCRKEMSLIQDYFDTCGYHTSLNQEANLEVMPKLLDESTHAVVVWFIGDILRVSLHDIVTKVCDACKQSQKAVIINQRMDWHQTNFHPKAKNLLVASFAGDTALMSSSPGDVSFAARVIGCLERSHAAQGLASSLLMAAHHSNARLASGSFLSFSSLDKDIQLKT